MYLDRIEDHRSPLERATRMELYRFAQANGVVEIRHEMPASVMRKILEARGLTNIRVPPRQLGMPYNSPGQQPAPGNVATVDADDILMREWMPQPGRTAAAPSPPPVPSSPQPPRLLFQMGVNELRKECRRLGIRMTRGDNMDTLRAKLEVYRAQNAASGGQ